MDNVTYWIHKMLDARSVEVHALFHSLYSGRLCKRLCGVGSSKPSIVASRRPKKSWTYGATFVQYKTLSRCDADFETLLRPRWPFPGYALASVSWLAKLTSSFGRSCDLCVARERCLGDLVVYKSILFFQTKKHKFRDDCRDISCVNIVCFKFIII